MHNLEYVIEYEMREILWDFQLRTDHLITARRPDLVIFNKKIMHLIVDFAVPVYHRNKLNEREKKDKYLDLT